MGVCVLDSFHTDTEQFLRCFQGSCEGILSWQMLPSRSRYT
jgi:hypothetical protein